MKPGQQRCQMPGSCTPAVKIIKIMKILTTTIIIMITTTIQLLSNSCSSAVAQANTQAAFCKTGLSSTCPQQLQALLFSIGVAQSKMWCCGCDSQCAWHEFADQMLHECAGTWHNSRIACQACLRQDGKEQAERQSMQAFPWLQLTVGACRPGSCISQYERNVSYAQ